MSRVMEIDTSKWSGEGEFTQVLIDSIALFPDVEHLRVEDAQSTRAEVGYNFIANELFVSFEWQKRIVQDRWLGILPVKRTLAEKRSGIPDLERRLSALESIGPPDYADEGMLQYLKTERIVPPYQTRGFKLIELVRIYEAGVTPSRE